MQTSYLEKDLQEMKWNNEMTKKKRDFENERKSNNFWNVNAKYFHFIFYFFFLSLSDEISFCFYFHVSFECVKWKRHLALVIFFSYFS